MGKYTDRPCARCGEMMIHAWCSQRYCADCAVKVHKENDENARIRARTKRVAEKAKTLAGIARAASAAGMSYGMYVAMYEPRKESGKNGKNNQQANPA